jgi:antitoxin (DNA-binding transcriptional repressor) of toxin-antitoxin stability system
MGDGKAELWQGTLALMILKTLGADAQLVGLTVTITRQPFVVIGVARRAFTGTHLVPEDAYIPFQTQPGITRDRSFFANPNMSDRSKPDLVEDDVQCTYMKKYGVAMVRERFSQVLDEALAGEPVFIERNGVTYRLTVEKPKKPVRRKSYFEILDPAVEAGQWTWDWSPGKLRFRSRLKTRKRKA